MSNVIISLLSGALGGALSAMVAWIAQDFFQKPFRSFFDLKRQAHETYLRYANVAARTQQVVSSEDNDKRRILSITDKEEERLQDAEAAMRDYATKFTAFAQTERATLRL